MKKIIILSLFLASASFVQAQWYTIEPPSPCTARTECGLAAHKGAVYLLGGRGKKPVEKYVFETNTWTPLMALPVEMHHITPVSTNGKIYIVGGLTGDFPDEQPLTHVYVFDPKEKSLKKVFEIPEDRRRGAAGVVQQKGLIYIVGGISNGHTSGTSAMFDVYDAKKNTWTVLPDAPRVRDHNGAAIVDDLLIAVGGRNTSYHEEDNFTAYFDTVIDQVDYFNLKTQKWDTYEAKLPAPAAGAGTVGLEGMVYFIGGETREGEGVARSRGLKRRKREL